MTTRRLIPSAPSSFSETRKGLPRRVNNRSQGRFPITSITAGCWAFSFELETFFPIAIGGGQQAPEAGQEVNVLFCHLFTNDRPVNIESRYSCVADVGVTGFELRDNISGQPAALVGGRWGEADLWPALQPPSVYGEPGLLVIPTPPGEDQRTVEGYPIILTPGALPHITVEGTTTYAEGRPNVVVHTESSVSHGPSGKRIESEPGGDPTLQGSCLLRIDDYTPQVQEDGFIEFALMGGAGTVRLQVAGVFRARLYQAAQGGIPPEVLIATELEAALI